MVDGRFLTDMPENCVMLCHDCHHNVVHGNNKKYRQILLDIASEIYGVKLYAGPRNGGAVFTPQRGHLYGTEEDVR